MCIGLRLPWRAWRELFTVSGSNSVVMETGEGQELLFENGAMVDLEGVAGRLGSDAIVRIPHPVEMPGQSLRSWRDRLAAKRAKLTLRQLNREVFEPPAEASDTVSFVVDDDSERRVSRFWSRGWKSTEWLDSGDWDDLAVASEKTFPHWGVTVRWQHAPTPRGGQFAWADQEDEWQGAGGPETVEFRRSQTPLRLADVPRVLFSECVLEVRPAHRKQKVWSPRPPRPQATREVSSNSLILALQKRIDSAPALAIRRDRILAGQPEAKRYLQLLLEERVKTEKAMCDRMLVDKTALRDLQFQVLTLLKIATEGGAL